MVNLSLINGYSFRLEASIGDNDSVTSHVDCISFSSYLLLLLQRSEIKKTRMSNSGRHNDVVWTLLRHQKGRITLQQRHLIFGYK